LEVVLKYPAQRSFSHGFGVLTLSTLLAAPTPWPTSPPLPAAAAGAHPRAGQRRKVERDLRNTASSVSVKSASEIDSLKTGNASVHEVLNDVPNVIYTDTVGAPIIRGQDTQGRTTAPTCSGAVLCRAPPSTLTGTT
jgi:hypothetical protein